MKEVQTKWNCKLIINQNNFMTSDLKVMFFIQVFINMPFPNIHNMCLLMNQTVTRSRTFQSISKLFGLLSIPLLNFFQPQLKCYLIDSLDWQPESTNLYDYRECSESSLVSGKSFLKVTSLEKPSSDFLSVDFESLSNIRELISEDEIIGFIGEFTEEENKSWL